MGSRQLASIAFVVLGLFCFAQVITTIGYSLPMVLAGAWFEWGVGAAVAMVLFMVLGSSLIGRRDEFARLVIPDDDASVSSVGAPDLAAVGFAVVGVFLIGLATHRVGLSLGGLIPQLTAQPVRSVITGVHASSHGSELQRVLGATSAALLQLGFGVFVTLRSKYLATRWFGPEPGMRAGG